MHEAQSELSVLVHESQRANRLVQAVKKTKSMLALIAREVLLQLYRMLARPCPENCA